LLLLLLPFKAMLLSEGARGRKSGSPPLFAPSFKVQRNTAHNRLRVVAPGLKELNARGRIKVRLGLAMRWRRSAFRFDGRFDYGRIVHWKADRPKRILGTCPNRVIDSVDAARFMTAASTP
jgi:hypothetical protein